MHLLTRQYVGVQAKLSDKLQMRVFSARSNQLVRCHGASCCLQEKKKVGPKVQPPTPSPFFDLLEHEHVAMNSARVRRVVPSDLWIHLGCCAAFCALSVLLCFV